MAVSFEDCPADQLPALQEFFARTYGPNYVMRVNEQHFRWQFGDTPASKSDRYHMRLGLVDGEIKGCVGYVLLEISIAGRVVHGVWFINWMVDPNQRQFGLGLLMMRQLIKEFDISLIVGANPVAHGLLTRLGWTDFGILSRYVCVLDTQAAGALTETGTLQWPAQANPEALMNVVRESLPQGVTTGLVDRFASDATQLWDGLWEGHVAGTRRSAEFLNWRYVAHPVLTYRLLEARLDGKLRGLAVYRVEQVRDMPVKVGRIVEIVAEEDIEAPVLSALLDDARSQGVAALDFFCASGRLAGAMSEYGFLPGEDDAAAQIPLLFQPLDRRRGGITFLVYLRNFPDAPDIQDWYVTKGDGDQDRPN